MKCRKTTEFFFNGICLDCFCKVQKEKSSCACPFETIKESSKFYYCSFCEEFHSPFHWTICKECAKKQDGQSVNAQKKEEFFSVGLPSMLVGVVVGFFLGYLLFVVLRRKRKKQRK
jgi:hypothetical protein